METGPVIAVMFYITFGWFSNTETFVAPYRDMPTCNARILTLETENAYSRGHRYCQLVGVLQAGQIEASK